MANSRLNPRARFARPARGPSTPRSRTRVPKRVFQIGQDVAMISNPMNMGHVVGFDPDGSVMVQWHGGKVVTGVSPADLRGLPPGYAGRRATEAAHAARRRPKPRSGKPRVVAVEKWVTDSSSGMDMPYDRFAFAKGSDLPAIFGYDELTVAQAISKLVEMGWSPDEFRGIRGSSLDEDEKLDMLVEWARENGKADNTYNWSWWGPTLHIIGVQEPDESGDPWKPELYFARAHLGGDVRGNYSKEHIFYVENPGEDAPWYSWRLTAQLTLDDGSKVILDAEDHEGAYWTVVEDPSGTFRAEQGVRENDLTAAFDWDEGVHLY